MFFGPVVACGMAAGMMFGGWLGNRIAARSVTELAVFCSWTMIGLVLLYLVVLWIKSLPLALAAAFFATAASVLYSASFTAAWQSVCDPRGCGTAAGISGFSNSLIGGALFTFAIGVMSDLWYPVVGAESLRYALIAGTLFFVLGSALFAHSARLIAAIPNDGGP